MKKIIEGRRYDTETANKVWETDGGAESTTDFRYWSEALYRTPRGRWFVYGEGGPLTKWAKVIGQNCMAGGQDIAPLSEQEARAWVEKHADAELYEEFFGSAEDA